MAVRLSPGGGRIIEGAAEALSYAFKRPESRDRVVKIGAVVSKAMQEGVYLEEEDGELRIKLGSRKRIPNRGRQT